MQENANKNILSCVRIKNVEYTSNLLACQSESQITIKDVYKKTSVDEYTFEFDRIFDSRQTIDDCYKYLSKNCLSKAFEGINCAVVALGVDGSGKTYTLFGDYSKQYDMLGNIGFEESFLAKNLEEWSIELFRTSSRRQTTHKTRRM
jgi:hypothetical protein